MTVTISPSVLRGTVTVPSSKSMAHRLLICAALADGISTIRNVDLSDDISATLDCLHALGIETEISDKTIKIYGRGGNLSVNKPLCCHESGSTLRFFIPICLFHGKAVTLTGTEKLLSRPLDVYENICIENNIGFVRKKTSLDIDGKLNSREFTVAGNISSQFITGLLMAMPTGGKLSLTGKIESRPYIHMTLAAMKQFGVTAVWTDERTLTVLPNQRYHTVDTVTEGDYSSAAFLEAFNCIGGNVKVDGLYPDSLQGDRVYAEIFDELQRGMPTVSLADCPDLAPILMAVAADSHGAVFTDTSRLKLKESDRGQVMAEELRRFGADIRVYENSIAVNPTALHRPTEDCLSHHDHRIAMSLSVLMTKYGGTLREAQAVNKSFPKFFDSMISLGANVKLLP